MTTSIKNSIIAKLAILAHTFRNKVNVEVYYSGRFDHYEAYESAIEDALDNLSVDEIKKELSEEIDDSLSQGLNLRQTWLRALSSAAGKKANFSFYLPDHVGVQMTK